MLHVTLLDGYFVMVEGFARLIRKVQKTHNCQKAAMPNAQNHVIEGVSHELKPKLLVPK